MKTPQLLTSKIVTSAISAASFLLVSPAFAAFQTVLPETGEIPGVALGVGTLSTSLGSGQSVVATSETAFISTLGATFTGKLRTMVVNNGGTYDFYYQVINTSASATATGDDIFRLAIPGYGNSVDPIPATGVIGVQATFLSDGVAFANLTGVPVGFTTTFLPNKGLNGNVYSADRDPSLSIGGFELGGAAFDFDPSQLINTVVGGPTSAPQNIDSGENSNWLVLRTDYVTYTMAGVVAQLTGVGTAEAFSFAPIPEPSTVLFGLAMLGACASSRRRKAQA